MTLGTTFLNPSDKRIHVAPHTPKRMQELSIRTPLSVIGGGTPVVPTTCERRRGRRGLGLRAQVYAGWASGPRSTRERGRCDRRRHIKLRETSLPMHITAGATARQPMFVYSMSSCTFAHVCLQYVKVYVFFWLSAQAHGDDVCAAADAECACCRSGPHRAGRPHERGGRCARERCTHAQAGGRGPSPRQPLQRHRAPTRCAKRRRIAPLLGE
jgi:hypothetical protein